MSSAASSTKTDSSTSGPSTVVVTAGAKGGSSKGSSTVGIAVGVVVGIIALAGIVGGAFLWLRYNKRKEMSDEYKRQAAISSFVEGGQKPPYTASSNSDSRLDPAVLAARRISDGSIADNADYSRRILQVQNPDICPTCWHEVKRSNF